MPKEHATTHRTTKRKARDGEPVEHVGREPVEHVGREPVEHVGREPVEYLLQ
jgi:hypothetical protein